jgi:hypothetical protein
MLIFSWAHRLRCRGAIGIRGRWIGKLSSCNIRCHFVAVVGYPNIGASCAARARQAIRRTNKLATQCQDFRHMNILKGQHAGLDCCNICYCQQRRAIVKEAKERARCTGTSDLPFSRSPLTGVASSSFGAPQMACAPRASKEAARSLLRGKLARGLETSSCSSGDHFSPPPVAARFSIARPDCVDVKAESSACFSGGQLSPRPANLVWPARAH